jgi:hypothetical protein
MTNFSNQALELRIDTLPDLIYSQALEIGLPMGALRTF